MARFVDVSRSTWAGNMLQLPDRVQLPRRQTASNTQPAVTSLWKACTQRDLPILGRTNRGTMQTT